MPLDTSIHAILHDRSGATWLGTNAGLVRDRDGVTTTFTVEDGLASGDVKTIIEAPDGAIWIGSFGGVTRWKDGVLWIGTYDGGLGRMKNGAFSRITTRNGLYDDGVFQIMEDRHGYLWMSGNRGIQRVNKREVNAVADGTAPG